MQHVALVTGASGGIGEALAEEHARRGGDLILVARSSDRLAAVATRLAERYQVTVETLTEDLTDAQAPQRIAAWIASHEVEVEVLVNNAGFGQVGRVVDTPVERLLAMIDLNVRALTHLSALLLPSMVARGRGRILNVASVAAFLPGPSMAVYYATKHFVHAFSQALAYETRTTGVTVTSLCPGPTRSGFQREADMEHAPLMRLPIPDAASVASFGYRAMTAGRRVAVPGISNKLLRLIAWLTPAGLAMAATQRMHGVE